MKTHFLIHLCGAEEQKHGTVTNKPWWSMLPRIIPKLQTKQTLVLFIAENMSHLSKAGYTCPGFIPDPGCPGLCSGQDCLCRVNATAPVEMPDLSWVTLTLVTSHLDFCNTWGCLWEVLRNFSCQGAAARLWSRAGYREHTTPSL